MMERLEKILFRFFAQFQLSELEFGKRMTEKFELIQFSFERKSLEFKPEDWKFKPLEV